LTALYAFNFSNVDSFTMQVTEGTLRSLSQDILQDRGPLPVGEIGKMLQEITGISTLSAYLKDKFGGLKKFLENYPEDFVIR
jgi:hypothetical protein